MNLLHPGLGASHDHVEDEDLVQVEQDPGQVGHKEAGHDGHEDHGHLVFRLPPLGVAVVGDRCARGRGRGRSGACRGPGGQPVEGQAGRSRSQLGCSRLGCGR